MTPTSSAPTATPVIGQYRASPTFANQQWSLVATSNPTQFNIQNGETNTFLSYAGAPSGSMKFAQAAIESTPRSFNVVQSSGAIGQFNVTMYFSILDVSTGLALTAWPVSTRRGSTITPVTYEPWVNGAVDQMWTFAT
ncbi:hypothetical protein MSAN_02446200 [Mycena sanguinolenta]|uniref:Uncharacterized protein n=1 Tax=Mycena sanguinolenta TaxID=230812 RepID=A0A8H6WYD6_9AGAR|nr:hypothetical protein MSAN_02446200 [Mycena sanguinolenta]